MQNAFGIAGGSGGVYREGGVMVVDSFPALQRFASHRFLPDRQIHNQPAPAVALNELHPLRGIAFLQDNACRACPPDADHGNERLRAAGQQDVHHVLPADAPLLQIMIYAPGQIHQLRVGHGRSAAVVQSGFPGLCKSQCINDIKQSHTILLAGVCFIQVRKLYQIQC